MISQVFLAQQNSWYVGDIQVKGQFNDSNQVEKKEAWNNQASSLDQELYIINRFTVSLGSLPQPNT